MKEYAQAEKEERRTADTLDRRGCVFPVPRAIYTDPLLTQN